MLRISLEGVNTMEKDTKRRRNKPFLPNVNLWLEVKADIEIKIIIGEYAAGGRIPSIVKLAEMYEVGNTTAQKVLESLCDDGTIVKQKGIGYFVKPYEKERLLKIHEKELKSQFTEVIEYGKRIGLDDTNILRLVQEALTALTNLNET
jgi:GntR family transcriptional regulator